MKIRHPRRPCDAVATRSPGGAAASDHRLDRSPALRAIDTADSDRLRMGDPVVALATGLTSAPEPRA